MLVEIAVSGRIHPCEITVHAFSLIKIPSFSVTRRWRGLYQLVNKFIEKYYEIKKEAASRPEKDRYELPNLLFVRVF